MGNQRFRYSTASSNREVITYGYAWTRFLLIPVFFVLFLNIFNNPSSWISYVWFAVCLGLFYLLKQARRIQHDDENVYIIKGQKEKEIHFSDIISIKRSNTKVNGSRFWKLVYMDELKKKRTCRYFADFTKEFRQSVKKVNPDVIIWTHPHFNH
jgi:Ca2+/Na+ antiporter